MAKDGLRVDCMPTCDDRAARLIKESRKTGTAEPSILLSACRFVIGAMQQERHCAD